MFPVIYPIILAVILFSLGVAGVLLRKNAIVILMSLELMFNAANLVFITFANYHQNLDGQVFIIFIMVTAAAEVAVGLALIVNIFRAKKTISIDEMHSLKG
ncbi:MAG TPA: NADH-quinone oxidoreductase subunit NuoK [Anaerolineaceae bacterium]|jgi:NADH-quinone oxidoreductase subunit K|nr:NADH-quinone oxidoreductase subunit NuoK [Chloroflexota bacterium]HNS07313.1 NADH-quinone oxidoreductase subunit NuoK [Anaerolineaceae bacterium]HNW13971.1 NADH-quinone oxidoreductase subunit NuoK [Anaerolineaceae bacterium]HOE01582.1 NADH-quinone oxidoreductase subunit NuoK [Anaerolineaceae bacterium]HOQ68732.1 NADH-quinone oxidoreductase subunit NuoK [Anaerolineaceae bacterium]